MPKLLVVSSINRENVFFDNGLIGGLKKNDTQKRHQKRY